MTAGPSAGGQTVKIAKDQGVTIGGGHSEGIGKDQATSRRCRVAKVGKDEALEVAAKMGVKVGATYILDVADSS